MGTGTSQTSRTETSIESGAMLDALKTIGGIWLAIAITYAILAVVLITPRFCWRTYTRKQPAQK